MLLTAGWAAAQERVPWTTSRVVGSPDPLRPYRTEPVFTNLTWNAPLYLKAEPGLATLLVVLQGGEPERPTRILRLPDDPTADRAETLLEWPGRLAYGLTFHPGYTTNGYLYVFSNGPTGQSSRSNRVSRFTVARTPPHACDLASEMPVIEWPSSGHDGGDLVFGDDGMLYITTGDGTSDSDGWVTGQDVTDLAGGVLRIDVDHPDADRAYGVPSDNPFLDVPGARPELWAYGLRNPWRMTRDPFTGHIWVGNNGQDLWETAHLIRRGDNCGWSVYEGSHPFYLHRPRGPTPVVPPTIEHPHSEFRSLTGGVVYDGSALARLKGAYIYGDYSTGKIWGARHDGHRLTWHEELADTTLQIAAFGMTHGGDLLIVDHGGAIHRLIASPPEPERAPFPTRLSDTGLFTDVARHTLHSGVLAYELNAPAWYDGATVERWIGLPGTRTIRYASSGAWDLPEGTVLMQTLSWPSTNATGQALSRRLETRLFTRQQGEWAGYSYQWNRDQTDGVLVPAEGGTAPIPGADRSWRFPGRTECLTCHSRASGFVLGVNTLQWNRTASAGNGLGPVNQITRLAQMEVILEAPRRDATDLPRLADPYDTAQPLDARARSYLHVNCSVCHVEAGGGNSQMDLRFTLDAGRMKLLEARPQHDTFGLPNAMLVAPGGPDRSVLVHRLSRSGPGQMPPLVRAVVDVQAVNLVRDWIQSMSASQSPVHEWTLEELEPALGELACGRSVEKGRDAFTQAGCIQCHRVGGRGGSVGPDLTTIFSRLNARDLLESILVPSKVVAPEYATTEVELLSEAIYVGRIEGEDATTLHLRPLGSIEAPLVLNKSAIRARRASSLSNMPTGLLDSLERGRVLDLLHFLLQGERDARK